MCLVKAARRVAMTTSFLMQQHNLVGNRRQAHLLMMSLIRHLSWCLSLKSIHLGALGQGAMGDAPYSLTLFINI